MNKARWEGRPVKATRVNVMCDGVGYNAVQVVDGETTFYLDNSYNYAWQTVNGTQGLPVRVLEGECQIIGYQ